MLTKERQSEIDSHVQEIDRFSEKYQLIHATVAIEMLFKNKLHEEYKRTCAELRAELESAVGAENQADIIDRINTLKSEKNKKIRIQIDYLPQISESSARTTKTPNNVFMISLPKSLEVIRDENGCINKTKCEKIRFLMAHELGHIVLHSGILYDLSDKSDTTKDEEANFFAEKLLSLRQKNSTEMCNVI